MVWEDKNLYFKVAVSKVEWEWSRKYTRISTKVKEENIRIFNYIHFYSFITFKFGVLHNVRILFLYYMCGGGMCISGLHDENCLETLIYKPQRPQHNCHLKTQRVKNNEWWLSHFSHHSAGSKSLSHKTGLCRHLFYQLNPLSPNHTDAYTYNTLNTYTHKIKTKSYGRYQKGLILIQLF